MHADPLQEAMSKRARGLPPWTRLRRYVAFLRPRLSEKRYRHSLSTYRTALVLAHRFGVTVDELALAQAALLHDCAKELAPGEAANLLTEEERSAWNRSSQGAPLDLGLYHGLLASRVVQRELSLTDGSVLRAIRYHNTGVDGGGALLELLVVSDYVEPLRDFDLAHRIALEDFPSLDDLVLEVQTRKMIYCLRAGKPLAPESVDAYNFWLARARAGETP